MKKVFFFDIDDTLLPTQVGGELSVESEYALKELIKIGHEVWIATGKNELNALDIIDRVGAKNYITSNGQRIVKDNKLFHHNPIDPKDVNMWKEHIQKHDNMLFGVQTTKGSYFLNAKDDLYEKYVRPIFECLNNTIPENREELTGDVYQIWCLGEVDTLEKTGQEDNYQIFRWNEKAIDILTKNISKAAAIRTITKEYTDFETYAFGDGPNDVEMFRLVDHSVAMGNAHSNVQKEADEVTEAVGDNGVYKYLVKNNFIGEYNES